MWQKTANRLLAGGAIQPSFLAQDLLDRLGYIITSQLEHGASEHGSCHSREGWGRLPYRNGVSRQQSGVLCLS